MFSPQLLIGALCLVFLVTQLRRKKTEQRRLPGPPPTPVLGNVFGIDTRHPWKTYAKWGQEYGDIIYTRLFTQEIIVINSEKIAQDLLEKRSQNYSSRPLSIYSMSELIGIGFGSAYLPYNDRWRRHRRLFHQAFHLSSAPSFRPSQLRKARDLIMRMAMNPHDFEEHLQLFSASTIMSIIYDYDPLGMDDPIISAVERMLEMAVKQLQPEVTAIVAALPFLKYLPEWFPGVGLKRNARLVRESLPEWLDAPFEYVKNHMASGTASPSMVLNALLKIQDSACTEVEVASLEKDVKEACASAYSAASETTHSTLMIFILAMVLYPDVQTKAQAEIDSIIGRGLLRLPDWEDRSSLPYVEAVIKEMLRWNPAVPLGIPHATLDDDIYEGYHIPKGAMVIYNAWALTRDPIKFPEPEKFKPERFLNQINESIHQLPFAFGYGRRACVGRYIADASLWISIVSMLAVFRFETPPLWNPGLDGANMKWTTGVTSHPVDIPVVIKPRHDNLTPERLVYLTGRAGL